MGVDLNCVIFVDTFNFFESYVSEVEIRVIAVNGLLIVVVVVDGVVMWDCRVMLYE